MGNKRVYVPRLPVPPPAPAGKVYEVTVQGQNAPTLQRQIAPEELGEGVVYRLINILTGRR